MRVNYRYLLDWVGRASREKHHPRILDYGCGSGDVVAAGRLLGLDIWGVDVFYEGSASRDDAARRGLLGDVIREIRDGVIDFADHYFDIVVSNQVFEHVEDLETTLEEINRVMTDDAILLCLFPSRDVIREGHIGIPLVHWFSKGSRLRYAYAITMRSIGFGHRKEDKPRTEWTAEKLEWLDQYTIYRKKKEIERSFSKCFRLSYFEDDYIRFRLGETRLFASLVPLLMLPAGSTLRRFLFHKFAGMIVLAQKLNARRGPDAVNEE